MEETTKMVMNDETGKATKGTVHWILLPVWAVETHGKELRVDGDSVH